MHVSQLTTITPRLCHIIKRSFFVCFVFVWFLVSFASRYMCISIYMSVDASVYDCECMTSIKSSQRAHLLVVEMLRFMSLTKSSLACPLLFILFLCLLLSLWPFQLYFSPYILRTTVRFLTLFFRSYFCLTGPLYLFMKVSLAISPDIILCGSLGLKHHLTN